LEFPEIPKDLIAQNPLEGRDGSRLMVVNRQTGVWEHRRFWDLPTLFSPGDVLVMNNVKVFPARLTGRKVTGGRVKLLLLKRLDGGIRWTSLLTPALKAGAEIQLEEGLSIQVERKRESGEYELLFSRLLTEADVNRLGRMPLPPYIRRDGVDPTAEILDRQSYQTVFAAGAGDAIGDAVAAPTAGLHFTEKVLDDIRGRGVETVFLRLSVGWGTFRPVTVSDYRDHPMLPEEYEIPITVSTAVNDARKRGNRVWAVGTTVVRSLENAREPDGSLRAGEGTTSLYVYPGFQFHFVNALITNFHLPGHTPLLLAAAFAGTDLLRQAYGDAIQEDYRFFSYGDSMAIL
jgi:S-adenosylmethionine:tRNA ribosyltransferase-isomerase